MADTSSASSGGIGVTGCLFLIFLVLKLAEVGTVAHWSWWWVTSPLWLPPLVVVVVLIPFAVWKALAWSVAEVRAGFARRRRMNAAMGEDE